MYCLKDHIVILLLLVVFYVIHNVTDFTINMFTNAFSHILDQIGDVRILEEWRDGE